jgi:hypothetical protein
MSFPDYRFETRWRVRGSLEEVTEILSDAPGLARWWSRVYLSVREIEPGVFVAHTKGWLPYTLSWSFRVLESRAPYGFTIAAWGDLEGTGIWELEQEGNWTNLVYLWTVQPRKPLIRNLSFLFKPIFAANHRWAMARGEEGLTIELRRRRDSC